jgi:rhodanese-related sulfurtransferase
MISTKMEKVLENLTSNYMPFTLLSEERISEVVNAVRFIEMRANEIYQITGGKGNDYLFVIEGSLNIITSGQIRCIEGPEETRKAPVIMEPQPAASTIVARSNCIICHADREMLDDLISWDEFVHMMEDTNENLASALDQVRNSLVFRRMPLELVEMAFSRMHSIEVKKGESAIKQGEAGNSYYIITSGSAEVHQLGLYDDEPQKIAELQEGDAFGCDALISGSTRSETVIMKEDSTLSVLDKSDFDELISNPLIKKVNQKVAKTMFETDYIPIDVRYAEEYDDSHIPDAILIPLFELRNRMDELDKSKKYIAYCHGGSRSAVATLVLTQNQFDVQSLDGGLRDWEYETNSI